MLSYFTDLQGSQTFRLTFFPFLQLSYFTDLQGSQTLNLSSNFLKSLVTLLIYKVLKPCADILRMSVSLVTLLIYKVLKRNCIST